MSRHDECGTCFHEHGEGENDQKSSGWLGGEEGREMGCSAIDYPYSDESLVHYAESSIALRWIDSLTPGIIEGERYPGQTGQ